MRKLIITILLIIFTTLTGIGLLFIRMGELLDFLTFVTLQAIIIFYLFYYDWPNIKTKNGCIRALNIIIFYVISIFAFSDFIGAKFL